MNIYDFKIGDRLQMIGFGKPENRIVIGHDEPTKQVRLGFTDGGMGSSYYTVDQIEEHQKILKSIKS